jgi:type I restriction enzyme, S subunit
MHNVAGWRTTTLSNSIESLDAGVSVNAEDRPRRAGEIGVLKTSAISEGIFRPEQNKAVLPVERALVAEPVLADSILLSRMNTPALVGECCYIEEAQPTLFLPDRIWQLKPKSRAVVSMRWLSFVLRSDSTRAYIETHASGTSGSMKNLAKSKLMALRIDYPPFAEQVAIAGILDTLDKTIRQTEAIIEKLLQIRQGLLCDLMTRGIDANGELRLPQTKAPHLYKDSPLGWIPKEWEPQVLDQLIDQRRPIVYGILMPGAGHDGGVPVIKVKDIIGGHVKVDGLLLTSPAIDREYRRSRLNPGDLLFTIRGSVGRTAFVPEQLSGANITQDTARIGITGIDARFAREYLGMPVPTRFVSTHTLGVAVQGINLRDVRQIPIAVPRNSEAKIIADILENADARLSIERSEAEKLILAKAGLMDDLLTGRVRVTPLLDTW